jgi:hypothetical protein
LADSDETAVAAALAFFRLDLDVPATLTLLNNFYFVFVPAVAPGHTAVLFAFLLAAIFPLQTDSFDALLFGSCRDDILLFYFTELLRQLQNLLLLRPIFDGALLAFELELDLLAFLLARLEVAKHGVRLRFDREPLPPLLLALSFFLGLDPLLLFLRVPQGKTAVLERSLVVVVHFEPELLHEVLEGLLEPLVVRRFREVHPAAVAHVVVELNREVIAEEVDCGRLLRRLD